jgi:hypothetical protein
MHVLATPDFYLTQRESSDAPRPDDCDSATTICAAAVDDLALVARSSQYIDADGAVAGRWSRTA